MEKKEALAAGRNQILAHAKSCWAPQVDKANAAKSHYFGSPWLAEGEPWPLILGRPALFVLQLDLTTLPLSMQSVIGNTGLLQLFYQADDRVDIDWEKGTSQLSLVRVVDPASMTGAPRPQPKVHGYPKKQAAYIPSWKERVDYPHAEEYAALGLAEELERIAKESGLYEDDFAGSEYISLQGDKLGGWPFWTQACDYPADSYGTPMELLYQIDAGCFCDGPHIKAYAKNLFASDGTGQIFVSRNDRTQLRFEWATG